MRSIIFAITASVLLSFIGGCEYDGHRDHHRYRDFDAEPGRYHYDHRYDGYDRPYRDYDRGYRDYDRGYYDYDRRR